LVASSCALRHGADDGGFLRRSLEIIRPPNPWRADLFIDIEERDA
jgi:hypothetical protein